MSNQESKSFLRLLGAMLLTLLLFYSAQAQMSYTDQAGGFGPFVGIVHSELKQPTLAGSPATKVAYQKGFEVGIKSEVYRFNHLRGNLMASYIQLGATEWTRSENTWREVDVSLKAFKVAFDPFLFKIGSDFIHGYAGGGAYGTFFIEQQVGPEAMSEGYWNGTTELKKFDYGVDLVAGVHVWSFDLEFHAQLGQAELGQRNDDSIAKQQFYSLTLAYLWVNQHTTIKSCKRKRSLRKVY